MPIRKASQEENVIFLDLADPQPSVLSIPFEVEPETPVCHLCKKECGRNSLLRLRTNSPRSRGFGYRPCCLKCLWQYQPLLPTDTIPIGAILALHAPLPKDEAKDNVCLRDPSIPRSKQILQLHAKRQRAMSHVSSFAVVFDTGSSGELYVYCWSDDKVSQRHDDTLARSGNTGDWWSLNGSEVVTVRRATQDDEKPFYRRFESALLRGEN